MEKTCGLSQVSAKTSAGKTSLTDRASTTTNFDVELTDRRRDANRFLSTSCLRRAVLVRLRQADQASLLVLFCSFMILCIDALLGLTFKYSNSSLRHRWLDVELHTISSASGKEASVDIRTPTYYTFAQDQLWYCTVFSCVMSLLIIVAFFCIPQAAKLRKVSLILSSFLSLYTLLMVLRSFSTRYDAEIDDFHSSLRHMWEASTSEALCRTMRTWQCTGYDVCCVGNSSAVDLSSEAASLHDVCFVSLSNGTYLSPQKTNITSTVISQCHIRDTECSFDSSSPMLSCKDYVVGRLSSAVGLFRVAHFAVAVLLFLSSAFSLVSFTLTNRVRSQLLVWDAEGLETAELNNTYIEET